MDRGGDQRLKVSDLSPGGSSTNWVTCRSVADGHLLHVKLDNEPRGFLWNLYARKSRIDLDVDRGLAFDTNLLAVSYAMAADGIALADIDLFAPELADGRLVMPYDTVIEDGFGYYLKLRPEDVSDPAIGLFRSWLIARFAVSQHRTP